MDLPRDHGQQIEALATAINWVGLWRQADVETPLRSDALAWTSDEVRRYAASGGTELPPHQVDHEDSPCPFTGAGACWKSDVPTPWWVEAQSHTDGPADDESIPRKLEGWWRVIAFHRDAEAEVGQDLEAGELCFLEKLWTDRVRIFKAGQKGPMGEIPLSRVCDLQLMKAAGASAGSRWDLLRDVGEGGDDPDDIQVGQKRLLLGGEYGSLKLKGLECEVLNYVEWLDRWTVEIPVKDQKGKNLVIAVIPAQLRHPKLPRDPKSNAKVNLGLALRSRALELSWQEESDTKAGGTQSSAKFRLQLRYVSRVRPGGRIWTSGRDSMYRYLEVRYVASGDYGLVFRVLRMVDPSKATHEEDPHLVLDVPRGSDRTTVSKAYRRLARRWHPDKVKEEEHDQAVLEFRRIHQAYENLIADPERSSDLMILKMQHPVPAKKKRITVPMAFQTEAKCLSLVSQLRLSNVQKLVEVGPANEFIVSWPYVPEALIPNNQCDGVSQVDRVDLVRQGWSDYSRSRHCAQKIIQMMVSLIRHDVMIVDPMQNIIIDRESGEPLMIDFGRGETAGSIYTTRIKTFMKKVLQLLARSISKASYDVAARYIRSLEDTLFQCLERWQDERTRDQKKALALATSTMKWQEGIECCREIWHSDDENPFRKMFKDQKDVLPGDRVLREACPVDADSEPDSETEQQETRDDDPEGLCDADINTLTPVQRLLRAKRKKNRRIKQPEKPNVRIHLKETLADGTLGLGLDDADEDLGGLIVVSVERQSEKWGWQPGDRIVELNGIRIDEWDDFKSAWATAKQFSTTGVVFGVVREGLPAPDEPAEARCWHCNVKGNHLLRCSNWAWSSNQDVFFCGRDCQKQAWLDAKRKA
ncbi:dnaJ [Symbiodinium pilosum]|uniref:DnaJ protein n=1 Tax=Symbiodinium pilosum TaxID=2952 RepID=A0A812SG38_SYMPI|nr:dnaJ [Symbiodinium pilosum]